MSPRSRFQPVLVLALVVLSPQVMSNQSFVSSGLASLEPATEPIPSSSNITLAVNSYMTWWGEPTNRLNLRRDRDLSLSAYSPLLGSYDSFDPAAIDWHIKWAVEHGITVFFINHRIDLGGSDPDFERGFLKSRYLDMVKFAYLIGPAQWLPNKDAMLNMYRSTLEGWSSVDFSNPSYFRINSRPVIQVNNVPDFLSRWGPQVTDELINMTREIPRRHGLDVYLIGDVMLPWRSTWPPPLADRFDALDFFFFGDAPDIPFNTAPDGCKVAPYSEMVRSIVSHTKDYSDYAKQLGKPFIPTAMPGVNNEKLHLLGIDDWCLKFTDPSPDLFKALLQGVKAYVDKNLRLLFVNSWNEFNEEHVIEPTREYRFSYVDVIRTLFAVNKSANWPPDIAPTRKGFYIEYQPDGTNSTSIPINRAWSALGSATNITDSISKNATSPIFKSPQANQLFSTAAKQYRMALDAFYKNDFENATRLVRMAIQSMDAAFEAEQQHPSATTSEATSSMMSVPPISVTSAIPNPAFFVVAAIAIILTTAVLWLRSKKEGKRNEP